MFTACFNMKIFILPTGCILIIRVILRINSINQLFFVMGMQCPFYEVETESLYIIYVNFTLKRGRKGHGLHWRPEVRIPAGMTMSDMVRQLVSYKWDITTTIPYAPP
jgi:hypothetical protein